MCFSRNRPARLTDNPQRNPSGSLAAMPHQLSDPAGSDPEGLFEGTPYRGIRRLAMGGMAEIVLVEHRQLERQFVAKLLHPRFTTNPQYLDRLRIEAQSLGGLEHPHIVTVTGFGNARDGRPFIVMEVLHGQTLGHELKERGALPALEAVKYACQTLSAIGAAHALGIVHRDLKPENLFLHEPQDGIRIVKVLDFGIARVLPGAPPQAPEPLSLPTDTGVVVGTPRYVSPEAASGQRVDQRGDLYAIGVVLYAMLAGRGPFDDLRTESKLLQAHAAMIPEPPSHYANEAISPALDRVVLKALEKNPDKRFQSAAEFAQAILTACHPSTDPSSSESAAETGASSPTELTPSMPAAQSAAGASIVANVTVDAELAKPPGDSPWRQLRRTLLATSLFLLIAVVIAFITTRVIAALQSTVH